MGSVGVGILGYLLHVVVGRLLPTGQYALFNAVMALFAVFSAALATLQMVVSRQVSRYRALGDTASTGRFFYAMQIRMTAATFLALLLCLPAAPVLQAYLKAPAPWPVYLLGMLVLVSVPLIINDAFLQGLQRFPWLSFSIGMRAVLRILFCVVLILLGFGVEGAVGGTVAACAIAWLITYLMLRPTVADASGGRVEMPTLRQSAPVLAANVAFAAMTQLDMVLVNYYFPAHEAGLYAAASVLGKAVMYLPGGISMALFPMVAENEARERGSGHLLAQAAGLTLVLCLAGAVFYLIFADFIVSVLYGPAYAGAGEILRFFGFAMVPMGLVLIAEYFLIAKGRLLFAYLLTLSAPLQLAAIHSWHGSLINVVWILGASGGIVMLLGYAFLFHTFRVSRKVRVP